MPGPPRPLGGFAQALGGLRCARGCGVEWQAGRQPVPGEIAHGDATPGVLRAQPGCEFCRALELIGDQPLGLGHGGAVGGRVQVEGPLPAGNGQPDIPRGGAELLLGDLAGPVSGERGAVF